MNKFLTILIIFCGEALAILAEIIAAKYFAISDAKFATVFFKALPLIILGGILLLCGYMLGLRAFKNIWIVSAVSITSILIIEPIVNYTVTGQTPTKGALIGLIFGVLGFIAAFFI
jgi:hypothetical protein